MTMDGWIEVADRVCEQVPLMWAFYVVFIFTTSIALLSLVPALFIEMNMTARDRQKELIQELRRKHAVLRDRKMLDRLFKITDLNSNDLISVTELWTVMHSE